MIGLLLYSQESDDESRLVSQILRPRETADTKIKYLQKNMIWYNVGENQTCRFI